MNGKCMPITVDIASELYNILDRMVNDNAAEIKRILKPGGRYTYSKETKSRENSALKLINHATSSNFTKLLDKYKNTIYDNCQVDFVDFSKRVIELHNSNFVFASLDYLKHKGAGIPESKIDTMKILSENGFHPFYVYFDAKNKLYYLSLHEIIKLSKAGGKRGVFYSALDGSNVPALFVETRYFHELKAAK